jgi:hypothetical protein
LVLVGGGAGLDDSGGPPSWSSKIPERRNTRVNSKDRRKKIQNTENERKVKKR